jgi:hypothetical protein
MKNNTLPMVRYTKLLEPPVVGRAAVIWPVDHPSDLVSNTTWAVTSEVLAVMNCPDSGVEFWTHHTHYVPA